MSIARLLGRGVLWASAILSVPACYDGRYTGYSGPLNFYVDPVFGSDVYGSGTPAYPFKTIGFALQFAISGDTVLLAPGTYSAASNSELFPVLLKPGVTLLGDPSTQGATTLLQGGGNYTVQGGAHQGTLISAGVVMGSGSTLSGVQVTVTGSTGTGAVFDGTSGTITSCTFKSCGASGIQVFQSVSPTISTSVITQSGAAGIVTSDSSAPVLRGNMLTSNATDGLLAQDTSTPNLGDAVTPGANTLQGNTTEGLANNTTASSIPAAGNTWNASVQGADSSGHYPTGPANPAVTGTNYSIANAAASIQF